MIFHIFKTITRCNNLLQTISISTPSLQESWMSHSINYRGEIKTKKEIIVRNQTVIYIYIKFVEIANYMI